MTSEDLCQIVTESQQRTFAEEVSMIESLGGEDALLEKMRTDRKKGVDQNSLAYREEFFGTNKKDPLKLKTLMQIFIQAFDDFTLKILIVAAITSIGKPIYYNKIYKFLLFNYLTISQNKFIL